jgi:hypothetical protein
MKRFATIALLIALVGCGGSKTFTDKDLSSILPGRTGAPVGLDFLPDSSGKQTIELVSQDTDQQTKLTSLGFQSAFTSFYANREALGVLQHIGTTPDPGAHVITMLGEIFKNSDDAHQALALNFNKYISTGIKMKQVAVKRVGDETRAVYGEQTNLPLPGYLIYWRSRNAVFAVLDAGGPTAGASIDTALTYALQMDERAQKI